MSSKKYENKLKRIAAFLVCLAVAAAFMVPFRTHAAETGKVVRVGWYESPACMTDKFGRRSGYAYDYQQKIAAYTNWRYEYVTGSWPELMQMLINGEIDLLSDVSYTDDRAEIMLFPSYAMGTEEYYLFVSAKLGYVPDSPSWFDGKKVGINKGSIMTGLFSEWEAQYGIKSNVIELTSSEEESYRMLTDGELDAFLTMDAYGGNTDGVPVFKIGSSDFYFAVTNSRQDLLENLEYAMGRILDENRFYNQQLLDKYVNNSGANIFLSSAEKDWLLSHGKIRIGYQENYLSFCGTGDDGNLTGALKNYLDQAADCLGNAHIDFETVGFSTSQAAMEALRKGEIDCMFPSNLSIADGEEMGFIITPPIMKTETYALVRKSDQKAFAGKENIVTAIEKGNHNYLSIVKDHFSDWKIVEYSDIQACMRAVSKGEADCVLISNYRYNNLAKLCDQYGLSPLATGEEVEYSIALRRGNKELYSILTRTTSIINNTVINAALTYYSVDESKPTLIDFLKANPAVVIASVVVIVALIAVIIAQNRMIKAKKEAEETHLKVDDLNKRVYLDPLTSVKNKRAFDEYIQKLQDEIARDDSFEFAIAMFDCDRLKQMNDLFGHDKGDVYLKTAAQLICRTFTHSPVFRIGGDEFVVVLQNEDFRNRDALSDRFKKNSEETRMSAENRWEKVSVSIGIAVFDPDIDRNAESVVLRADQLMYANKRARESSEQA